MADYGVTPEGFVRKPYESIKKEIEEKARELFGAEADLSVYSPIGMFANLLGWQSHLLWQELENAYYANWLDTAEGLNLDRVVQWGGISRKGEQKAIIQDMKFTGDPGAEIPAGFQVQTAQGVVFETAGTAVIGQDGTVEAVCTALKAGEQGVVPAGSVTEIVAPLEPSDGPQVTKAVNISASFGGRGGETDAELRARYKTEGAEGMGSSTDAVKSNILNVEGVISANVYENTEISSVMGRPPKSIECIVLGGADISVADAVFEAKSAGIETYGKTTLQVEDTEGKKHFISFNRPVIRDVYVQINLDVNASFAGNPGEEEMKTNIIRYIGGVDTHEVDGDTKDTYYPGLGVGEEVYPWRVAAVNREVQGIENIEVRIGFINSTTETTSGYQTIVPGPDSVTSFVPDAACGLTGTYTLLVDVDNPDPYNGSLEYRQTIELTLANDDTWEVLVDKLGTAINGASTSIESVVVEGDPDETVHYIKVSSDTQGEGSTVLITDSYDNGLLAAINSEIAGLDAVLEDPIEGINSLDSDKLKIGPREIARCDNDNITINITSV